MTHTSSPPDPPRERRARTHATRVAVRMAAYFFSAWSVVVWLAASWHPWAGAAAGVTAIYTTCSLLLFARWRGWPFYPRAWFRLVVVRPFWYAQLLLPFVSGAGLLGLLLGLPFGRATAAGQLLAGFVLIGCALILLAGYIGASRLVVRHVDAAIAALPEEFDGFRIAQLSDLHVGPHTSRRFLERIVRVVRDQSPDLVALTGDLVDDRAEDVAVFEDALGALSAPSGKFLIPGNHDVYAGWDAVERNFARLGSGILLLNEAHLIRRGPASIALIGTGDPAGGIVGASRVAPDIDRALRHVPPRTTVIALAHNPALWPTLAARGVALTLSGHTHWGQLAIPSRAWSLATPFLERAMLAHQLHDALLYISPGTGYWGVPFRLGAYPEVTIVTLRTSGTASVTVHPALAA